VVLWVAFCSYSYSSDYTYGTTNNAAAEALNWSMQDVLPPQAGLQITGMFYRYTMEKDPAADAKVHIGNKEAGKLDTWIIRETDDWSGLPGNTINRLVKLQGIPRDLVGDGSIEVEGEGSVNDPSVIYSYRYDECYIPLTSPDCPGYLDSLYAWLKANGLLDNPPEPGDPYYDEWVQATLNQESEEAEEEEENKDNEDLEEEEENERIIALTGDIDISELGGTNQEKILSELNNVQNFDNYYKQQLPGGQYSDVVVLQDATLPDNRRALSNLARDEKHRQMVRSQYEN
jgi:hypothetical protein